MFLSLSRETMVLTIGVDIGGPESLQKRRREDRREKGRGEKREEMRAEMKEEIMGRKREGRRRNP
jgi:hypothetical protein